MTDVTAAPETETTDERELPAAVRLQVRMPGHDRERSLGWLATAWIEHFALHGFGDVQGSGVHLDQDFYDLTIDAYALDTTGRRLYRTVVVCRPKGTAKSEFSAYLSMFDALGPSRFAGWAKGGEEYRQGSFRYVYSPGEPMGRRIPSPFVRMLATEEAQVKGFYRNTWGFNLDPFNGGRLATELPGIERFESFAILPEGGRVEPSTAGAASKDGGLETCVIADEPHLYTTPQLRQMYDTVDRNLGKRKAAEPWMLLCSTMYADGEDSTLERLHKLALAVKEGVVENPGLLFDHIEGGVITDLRDTERLRAVIEGVYAGRDWVDVENYMRLAMDPTKDASDFRRYTLNQRGGAATAYLTPVQVENMCSADIPALVKGDTVTLGFDYAPGTSGEGKRHGNAFRLPDSTALVAYRLSDHTIHRLGLWEAPASATRTGWNPPDAEIDAAFDDAFRTYNVIGVYADPSHTEDRLTRLTAKHRDRLKVKASLNRPMFRYMSGGGASWMAKTIDNFYSAVTTGGVRMVADPALMRHFTNARRVVRNFGVALHKRTPESPEKIDALVTAILAWAAGQDALNKGLAGPSKPRRSRRSLGTLN